MIGINDGQLVELLCHISYSRAYRNTNYAVSVFCYVADGRYQFSLPIARQTISVSKNQLSRLSLSYYSTFSTSTLHYSHTYHRIHKHKMHSYSTITTQNPTNALGVKYISIEDAENIEQYCPGATTPHQ